MYITAVVAVVVTEKRRLPLSPLLSFHLLVVVYYRVPASGGGRYNKQSEAAR